MIFRVCNESFHATVLTKDVFLTLTSKILRTDTWILASTEALISEDGVLRGNMQSLEQGVKKQKKKKKTTKLSRGITKAWQQPCRKWLWIMAINLRRKKSKKKSESQVCIGKVFLFAGCLRRIRHN